jgi:putative addiction module component (TIGR02574 family)
MTAVATKLIPLLEPLGASDRAELASWLFDSIEDSSLEPDAAYEQAWDQELARRSKEIHSGAVIGTPAAAVFAEIRRKYL